MKPQDIYTDLEDDMYDYTMPEADSFLDYDKYINSEVLLPKDGEHMMSAKVIQCHTDDNGKALGKYSTNPILDTQVYHVMFPDGVVHQYAANIIEENLFNNVDGATWHVGSSMEDLNLFCYL